MTSIAWPLLIYLMACPTPDWPEISVEVRLETSVQPAEPLAARLHVRPTWSARPGDEPVPLPSFSIPVAMPASTSVRLCPDLAHEVSIGGEGVWSPARRAVLPGEPAPIRLTASRTGTVSALVIPSSPGEAEAWPVGLDSRFSVRASPLEVSADQELPGSCHPTTRRGATPSSVTCELPEGVLDLRVRPEGFVPLYAWDLRIEPGRTAKLSDLVLRRGASLVGRVEIEEGTSAASAEVVLEPAVSDPAARARLAGRMQTLSFRATTNQRGFYQIVGPPEGAYEVRASLSDYGVSDSIRATFDGPVEHTAEVLTIPFFPAAVVRVQPPVAPGGDPWTVRTLDPTGQQHSATTDPDGRAVFEVPKAGRYTAIVEDGDGGRWAMRSAELDRENPELLIEIDEVPVIGTVSLDGEPLPATLCFGGCSGGESIRVETDTDGAFTGVLSREGSWALEIQAEEPFVRQVFSAYPVELDEGLGAAELVIELPGTAIGGKVVDSLGQPVEGARLIVQARSSAGGTMQLASDPEGSFRLQGQPYGRYSVEAIHRRRRSASPEVVELSEDEPEATVEIVLGDPIELVGRVVTLSGEPVAGATIWPLGPADAEGPALTVPAVTGPDGDFELPVPPRGASAAVAVLANGFVLGIAEIPTATATSEPPTIRLFPEGGGSLQLIGEENGGAGSLVYEGRWRLDPALLTTWARRNGSPGGGPGRQDLTVPQLPSGSYRFCTTDRSGTRASCRSGYLSSSSSLILEPRKETR